MMVKAIDIGFEKMYDRFIIYFDNDSAFTFRADSVIGLDDLIDDELELLKLSPSGESLSLREKDIDISIKGLIAHLLGLNLKDDE